jgi:hypothetical protein
MESPIPAQVADILRGQRFATFDAFRAAFWKAVASIPELASQFRPQNRALMRQGLAPKAPTNHHVGGIDEFQLHHVKAIRDRGPVYDMENMRVVSPLRAFPD